MSFFVFSPPVIFFSNNVMLLNDFEFMINNGVRKFGGTTSFAGPGLQKYLLGVFCLEMSLRGEFQG